MNILDVIERFPNQEVCIAYLEKARWDNTPMCPHCESEHVGRKNESGVIGRWNCHDCHASFRVTHGTIFHDTKVPFRNGLLPYR